MPISVINSLKSKCDKQQNKQKKIVVNNFLPEWRGNSRPLVRKEGQVHQLYKLGDSLLWIIGLAPTHNKMFDKEKKRNGRGNGEITQRLV